jgi:hypothetical protein
MVRIGRDELVAIVGPDNEPANRTRIDALELKGRDRIVPNPGNRLWTA